MTDSFQRITWEEFVETYKPQQNHMNSDAYADGFMYNPSGKELEYVKEVAATDPCRVWTIICPYDDYNVTVSGFGVINVDGYIITEKPFSSNVDIEVVESDDLEAMNRIPNTVILDIMYRDGGNYKTSNEYEFSNQKNYTEHEIKMKLAQIVDDSIVPYYYSLPEVAALDNEFLPAFNDNDHSFVEVFEPEFSDKEPTNPVGDIADIIEAINNPELVKKRREEKREEARKRLKFYLNNIDNY